MLVLSRKIGERLVIGEGITVVVNRIAGNRVTLGIEAPSEVRIVRGELQPRDLEFAGAMHQTQTGRSESVAREDAENGAFLRLAK